jgi:hypothetical protein
MKRLCLVACGFLCTLAVADAAPLVRSKLAHPHAKAAKAVGSTSNSEGLAGVAFSDPYAPPVGAGKTAQTQFRAPPTDDPVEVKGGFSLTAGRDAAGEPMTGGLKFRF